MTTSKSNRYRPPSNWKHKILEVREVGQALPVIPYSEFRKLYKPVEKKIGDKKEGNNT